MKKCKGCGKKVEVYSDPKHKLCGLCDDDIPTASATDGKSISRWEIENGRGFWGNPTTGYHYDEDVNN